MILEEQGNVMIELKGLRVIGLNLKTPLQI